MMQTKIALSVRQPWAWAIIHAGKDLENRSWSRSNPGLKFRGRVAIHASKGMTQEDYHDGHYWITEITHHKTPAACDLVRGAIIGSVEIIDVVTKSMSPWWAGPMGLVLDNPIPCDPVPCVGQLGFWEWKPADPSVMPPPARWMLPLKEQLKAPVVSQDELFK
jgi:hypothetical protein